MRVVILMLPLSLSLAASAKNLHLLDRHENGYALWRSGQPTANEFAEWCMLGITKVVVLSGNAAKVEQVFAPSCPTIEVIYNQKQDERKPLRASFLRWFDELVGTAKDEGTQVLFRCLCGCHRTGRLAAYYQMKYQDVSVDKALEVMEEYGDYMWLFPNLDEQVRALHDYIEGNECSQKTSLCVIQD